MKARLVALTAPMVEDENGVRLTAEQFIIYTARVSNPSNQLNTETGPKLLAYLIDKKHWSPFEQASATIEIETSRAIAAQLLRHRSFTFQEFSQRYAVVANASEPIELRKKAATNRQSSEVVPPNDPLHWMDDVVKSHIDAGFELYNTLVRGGCAPETARFVLPLATTTTLYVTGSIRSFIHYFEQRCSEHAQKEHRQLANNMRASLVPYFPELTKALKWDY